MILFAIMSIACLTSCIRDVGLDAGEKPLVVVECVLKNSDVQELRLNFTKGASKAEAEPLTDAVAKLIDLTFKKEVGQFIRKEGDLWTLDYTPTPYHEYRLEVQVPGYELIYAEDAMPGKVKCYYACQDYNGLGHWFDDSRVVGSLEAGAARRYRDRTNKLNYLRGTVYVFHEVLHPFLIYGMNYNPVTNDYEIVEQLCTDHEAVSSATLSGGKYLPPSIIKELPKVQLHPYLAGAPLHNRYLMFPKHAEEIQESFVISGSFAGEWFPQLTTYGEEPEPTGYLMFVSMSDIYKRYLDDAIRLQILDQSTDMTSIYVRDNMYSNIHGGIGLFAAIAEERAVWAMIYLNIDAWEKYWTAYEANPEQFYDLWYTVDDRDGLYPWYVAGKLSEEDFKVKIGG